MVWRFRMIVEAEERRKRRSRRRGRRPRRRRRWRAAEKVGKEHFNLDGYYPKTVRLFEVPGNKRKG